ncbi:4-alpha-glucanotransferase [Quadrisphaera sp. DSM 44207]|uniref:4-alpha-glucanotransferase n=1 Tax=Quadrisphaera sp. DSM 44207 TaxID=1881057 RepID=UPI0008917103|nr:4-alpha-glucanotransferase [Quadrisphaera sp. DSM 44207]SDQ06221.1 4-alpha-glucanotransferase [Quadrisphaera sp. DSM 44207]
MSDTAQTAPSAERAPSGALTELAAAHGVATEYWDWQGRHVVVPEATIVAVLAALGVRAADEAQARAALAEHQLAPWRRVLPPVVVLRSGEAERTVPVHVRHGQQLRVWVELEDGGRRDLEQVQRWVEPQRVDGVEVGEATYALPAGLPLGWHVVRAAAGDGSMATASLVVTPDRLELPASLGPGGHRWGFMAQLYSVRSTRSWGLGDLADLAELLDWSGRDLGADFLLVNPLLAAEPAGRMQPSPYLPTTRRFTNPVYLRVEDVREVAYLPSAQRAELERLSQVPRAANTDPDSLDRDVVWAAKRAALEVVFAAGRSPARQASFEAYRAREGSGLEDFALWCALAERSGGEEWPTELQDPRSAAVARAREELAERVTFHAWLQWLCDEQLAAAQRTAAQAGMALGVVHDLAVGVHPSGADSWALRDVLARGVNVGAPPDAFNQQGQDWSQPPWRPDALAEAGYLPFRDVVRTILRHAGGLRVDHVIGLFRLWWVPQGLGPALGTYVRYDHDALVGILCLEAARAGAVVVGEDLGVVEPWVRVYLRERGVLGTSVLWWERDEQGRPLPPQAWRELCLATVTTHDLPPTAGYLAHEHVALRDRLGLLTRPVEEERAADADEQGAVLQQLRDLGLLHEGASEQDVVEALHAFLPLTPSRLLGVALTDAVGEHRTQNQPGTSDEHPNWRVPLADGEGRPVLVEDLRTSPRAASLAAVVAR